jgi:hypothetical protein
VLVERARKRGDDIPRNGGLFGNNQRLHNRPG